MDQLDLGSFSSQSISFALTSGECAARLPACLLLCPLTILLAVMTFLSFLIASLGFLAVLTRSEELRGPMTLTSVNAPNPSPMAGAGFFVDGDNATGYNLKPIACSMYRYYGGGDNWIDKDDYYIVNAGFKFEVYDFGGYGTFLASYDNTAGTTWTTFQVSGSNVNKGASVKVFYNNGGTLTEVTCAGISG